MAYILSVRWDRFYSKLCALLILNVLMWTKGIRQLGCYNVFCRYTTWAMGFHTLAQPWSLNQHFRWKSSHMCKGKIYPSKSARLTHFKLAQLAYVHVLKEPCFVVKMWSFDPGDDPSWSFCQHRRNALSTVLWKAGARQRVIAFQFKSLPWISSFLFQVAFELHKWPWWFSGGGFSIRFPHPVQRNVYSYHQKSTAGSNIGFGNLRNRARICYELI